jgi:hypothetical protein
MTHPFLSSQRADASPNDAEFAQLRRLVLGEEQSALRLTRDQIQYLEQIVRRQEERFATALNQVDQSHQAMEARIHDQIGPRAFAWLERQAASVEDHQRIGHMLATPVEAALRISTNQNREGLAHMLGPVMAPGIRSAVAEFFRRFVEQLDSLLRGANLPQRLWWRISAIREGVPYSEYVLHRTARYAVLLVQLIDKTSGLVICEVKNSALSDQSATYTSQSILANGLMHQSLPEWESMRVAGRRMALQVRTLGGGGDAVRSRASKLLGKCELELSDDNLEELSQAQADRLRLSLATLLSAHLPVGRSPWLGRIMLLAILAILTWWGVHNYKQHAHKRLFVEQLRATPGYAITHVENQGGNLLVHGLRDPLAPDPQTLAAEYFGPNHSVSFDLAPYLSAANEYERQRKALAEKAEAKTQTTLWEKADQNRAQLEAVMARQDHAIRERVITAIGGLPEEAEIEWDHDVLMARGNFPTSKLALLKEEAARMTPLAVIDLTEITPISEIPTPERVLEAMDVPFINGTTQPESNATAMVKQVVEQMQKVDTNSAHERRYRLRAWPIVGEKVEGNQGMQLTRLSLVASQLKSLGYPTERFLASITEVESIAGRRGVWVEVIPDEK